MDTFILSWAEFGLNLLRRASLFRLLQFALPGIGGTYAFVDAWVIINLFGAFSSWLFEGTTTPGLFGTLVVVYAGLRVLELVAYNTGVLIFDSLRSSNYALRSFRRSLILSSINYIEVLFWFAASYRHFATAFEKPEVIGTLTGSLYFSTVTMATVGYGDIVPNEDYSRWLIIVHILVSVFFAIVV